MRTTRLLLAALSVGTLLSGCGPAAAPTATPTSRHYGSITFKSCTLANDFASETTQAQCASWKVAENPAQPQGRQIALNIAWLPATSEGNVAGDPVFFLAGGPGQAATETWPSLDAAFTEVRKHRHVILVDQRGTGKSNPLICRNRDGDSAVMEDTEGVDAALAIEQAKVFAEQCARQLKADPRFYSTSDAIRDLDAVRAALGVDKINLVGISYGTRVAQQYAHRYPQHTRSVVLDGVVPNELVLGNEHARNLDAALALQFAQCQKLPVCRERFGADPRAQLRGLMQRLKASPVTVTYRDPLTGVEKTGTVSDGTVAGLTRMFAYAPQAAALLPLMLNEAQQGRYGPLMSLASTLETQLGEQIMHGMQLSVICAEDADLLRSDPADADTVLGNSIGEVLAAQCAVWPHAQRPKDFHAPLRSDLPVLLTSGEFDPVTPPRYGEQVVKNLANGRHLVLRGQGHGTFAVGCMPKLLTQFIENANAKTLDATCLDAVGYVPPFTTFNGWEP